MKKVYLLGIVLLVAISLLAAGCGSGSKSETKSRDNKSSTMPSGNNMGNMGNNQPGGMNNMGGGQSGNMGNMSSMDHAAKGHTGQ